MRQIMQNFHNLIGMRGICKLGLVVGARERGAAGETAGAPPQPAPAPPGTAPRTATPGRTVHSANDKWITLVPSSVFNLRREAGK